MKLYTIQVVKNTRKIRTYHARLLLRATVELSPKVGRSLLFGRGKAAIERVSERVMFVYDPARE